MEEEIGTLGPDPDPDIQDQVQDPQEDQGQDQDHQRDREDIDPSQDPGTSYLIINLLCMIRTKSMITQVLVPLHHHHHHHHQALQEHLSTMAGFHPILQHLLEEYWHKENQLRNADSRFGRRWKLLKNQTSSKSTCQGMTLKL